MGNYILLLTHYPIISIKFAFLKFYGYNGHMYDDTIISTSKIGKRLDAIVKHEQGSYLQFNNSKISMTSQITIGRASDNSVVIDNKLASRHHAMIQRIKDDYYLKDLDSTNGTLLNGQKIQSGKYFKLHSGDKITIGKTELVMN